MAGPGRPRKIQNEATSETAIQEHESQSPEIAHEPPVATDFSEQVKAAGWTEGVAFETDLPDFSAVDINTVLGNIPEIKTEQIASNNWKPIETVSRSGFPVKLTDDIEKPGVICFWRKSRAFANATHRWEETGFWTNSETGRNIEFIPTHWKDRHAV